SMHALITDVAEKYGRIDVLINNAAGMGMKDGRVDEISLEEFNAVVATDLGGTFNMIKEVLPFLLRNEKGGSIINI
ncbi:SDR family NAD(P)-dependent oxidoreductase, partial [Acinetobacter baumannii]|nr:SDR family NAD(P)-dependent oxidoreductase [Acinetobacter baumannii]